MYYTVNMTCVCEPSIYFKNMCIHLYIILLLLLSHSTPAIEIGCYKGESSETFSIQVDMRRVVYVSIHQLFVSFGRGGRKGKITLYKALVSNFCTIM